jgi:hypothetical protein
MRAVPCVWWPWRCMSRVGKHGQNNRVDLGGAWDGNRWMQVMERGCTQESPTGARNRRAPRVGSCDRATACQPWNRKDIGALGPPVG